MIDVHIQAPPYFNIEVHYLNFKVLAKSAFITNKQIMCSPSIIV